MLFFVLGLLGLSVVIIIHEFGHLLAAKALGIDVEAFSVGWGRPLVAVRRGGTEYRLAPIPLGGYCKMKGEEVFKKALDEDLDSFPKEEGALYTVAPWKRTVTYLAGPLFNLIFSILALSFIWTVGFEVFSYDPKIILASEYDGKSYAADEAGLQTGDVFLTVDGDPITNFSDLSTIFASSAGRELNATVKRGDNQVQVTIVPRLNTDTGAGFVGVSPWIDPVIGSVKDGSAAAVAGLQPGDRIIAVDGHPVLQHLKLYQLIDQAKGAVDLAVLRGENKSVVRFVPDYGEDGSPHFGFTLEAKRFPQQAGNPIDAVRRGASETFQTLSLSVRSIGLLFGGVNVRNAVSGPLRISYLVGEVAVSGFSYGVWYGVITVLRFLSLLSVALFFMNLLPIPALDGGMILLSIWETVTFSRVRPKVLYRIQTVGFVLILGLVVLTTFNDVFFFFTGG